MTDRFDIPLTNRVAVFSSLFFAFAARSVIGPLVFHGILQWVFYAIVYLSLGLSFINSFVQEDFHLYAPRHFFAILLLFVVVLTGLHRANEQDAIIRYAIAFLLPFAMKPEMKNTTFTAKFFVLIGIVLFFGSLLNYMFPEAFRAAVLPFFDSSAQKSIIWQSGIETAFPGFTSQVGYTSFFICTSFGTLFCFRSRITKKWFVPIAAILIFGLFLTGKRGPFIFLVASILIIYFYEGPVQTRVIRVMQILLIILAVYAALSLLTSVTNNKGIQRIFGSVQELATTRSVEDEGREQLRDKALEYFKKNPVWGIGWYNYKNLYRLRRTHVHNIYLQLLCETGIVGFLIFLSFFVTVLIQTLKKIKMSNRETNECSWLMFSLFMQIYFLLYGITGNPLYDIEETILYFFAVGISFLPLLTDTSTDNMEDSQDECIHIDISVCT